jgi:hypothetical protein
LKKALKVKAILFIQGSGKGRTRVRGWDLSPIQDAGALGGKINPLWL